LFYIYINCSHEFNPSFFVKAFTRFGPARSQPGGFITPHCLIYAVLTLTDFTIDRKKLNGYNEEVMKKGVHPKNYRPVVFQDLNNNTTYLTRSTVATEETITVDGTEYPLVKVHISGSSHPYFTGEERIVDVEGRVDKFKERRAAAEKARATRSAAKPKAKKAQKEEAQKLGSSAATAKAKAAQE
jgi:large subunit ribosomal protein L31